MKRITDKTAQDWIKGNFDCEVSLYVDIDLEFVAVPHDTIRRSHGALQFIGCVDFDTIHAQTEKARRQRRERVRLAMEICH